MKHFVRIGSRGQKVGRWETHDAVVEADDRGVYVGTLPAPLTNATELANALLAADKFHAGNTTSAYDDHNLVVGGVDNDA